MPAGALLGKGYIEVTADYKTALDEIRSGLFSLGSDARQTGQVMGESISSGITQQVQRGSRDLHDAIVQGTKGSGKDVAQTLFEEAHPQFTYFGQVLGGAIGDTIHMGIKGASGLVHAAVGELMDIAHMAVIAGGAAITAALGAIFYKGFDQLATIEQVRVKLQFFGQDQKTINQILSESRELAEATAMSYTDMANAAEVFVTAGVKPGEDLKRILQDVSDLSAASGESITAVSDTVLRAMQGNNNRLTYMLQTLEAKGVHIVQYLAEDLGKP